MTRKEVIKKLEPIAEKFYDLVPNIIDSSVCYGENDEITWAELQTLRGAYKATHGILMLMKLIDMNMPF